MRKRCCLALHFFSLKGTRWREQSGAGRRRQQPLVGSIFTSGVTLKACGSIFRPAQWAVSSPGLPWRGCLFVTKLELHLLGFLGCHPALFPQVGGQVHSWQVCGSQGGSQSAVYSLLHIHPLLLTQKNSASENATN